VEDPYQLPLPKRLSLAPDQGLEGHPVELPEDQGDQAVAAAAVVKSLLEAY